jgi:hypothetical protein
MPPPVTDQRRLQELYSRIYLKLAMAAASVG